VPLDASLPLPLAGRGRGGGSTTAGARGSPHHFCHPTSTLTPPLTPPRRGERDESGARAPALSSTSPPRRRGAIQVSDRTHHQRLGWIPAFAGMTLGGMRARSARRRVSSPPPLRGGAGVGVSGLPVRVARPTTSTLTPPLTPRRRGEGDESGGPMLAFARGVARGLWMAGSRPAMTLGGGTVLSQRHGRP
jgi:hypothetical protein